MYEIYKVPNRFGPADVFREIIRKDWSDNSTEYPKNCSQMTELEERKKK